MADQMDVCKECYDKQKVKTSRAARIAKTELDNLIEAASIPEAQLRGGKCGSAPNFNMPDDEQELANVKKLLFVNAQVSVAQSILQSLVAQDATWEHSDFLSEPTEAEQNVRIGHYQKASHLLSSMEKAFVQAAAIESKFFGPIWKASMDILKAYPETCAAGVGAGGLLGALSGGGLVTLNIGFRSFLISLFGEAGVLSGALVGGIAGVILAGSVVALIAIYQRSKRSQEEMEVEDLRLMKQRIAKIATQELCQSDLVELEDLFSKAFYQPMKLAVDAFCPICLDHFRADGGNNSERAIKAPNCQGEHMVHQKCLRDWQWQSGCDRCVLCRQ